MDNEDEDESFTISSHVSSLDVLYVIHSQHGNTEFEQTSQHKISRLLLKTSMDDSYSDIEVEVSRNEDIQTSSGETSGSGKKKDTHYGYYKVVYRIPCPMKFEEKEEKHKIQHENIESSFLSDYHYSKSFNKIPKHITIVHHQHLPINSNMETSSHTKSCTDRLHHLHPTFPNTEFTSFTVLGEVFF